jgi:Flp pilus assembly protein TadD
MAQGQRVGNPHGVGLAATLVCGLAASGCASLAGPTQLELAITRGGLQHADIVVPFELDDEMRAWVREEIPATGPPKMRVEILLARLLADDRLDLTYSAAKTGTASEVWRSGTANCVGFTHLFVGMAREAGLKVTFLRVGDIQTYSRDGDLVVVSGHMAVGYDDGLEMRVLDFSPYPVKKYRWISAIGDHTAVAMFYSNRGAEELRSGRPEEAVRLLELATRLDPRLPDAWVNLGVAHRRQQNVEVAERMYRQALAVDPESSSAYQNLAVLLRLQGRGDAAEELLHLAARHQARNPYTYIVLGDWSMSQRQFAAAQKFYKNALRVADRENADPLAAMGLYELRAGDPARALHWLEKAKRIDPTNDRVLQLERALEPGPNQRTSL